MISESQDWLTSRDDAGLALIAEAMRAHLEAHEAAPRGEGMSDRDVANCRTLLELCEQELLQRRIRKIAEMAGG
jgi:hypothetical protein